MCVRCCPSQCAALLAPPNGSAGVDLRSGRHLVYVYGETIMTGTRAMFDRRLNSTVQQLMQCPAIKPHVIAAITWRPTGALPKLPSVEFQRLAGVRTFATLDSRPGHLLSGQRPGHLSPIRPQDMCPRRRLNALLLGDLRLQVVHLTRSFLGLHESAHPKRHLDRFVRFCTAHPCAQ